MYLDSASVSQKMEVVGCLFVAKTHTLIPTGVHALGVHARKMVSRVWKLAGQLCSNTRRQKHTEKKGEKNFMEYKHLVVVYNYNYADWIRSQYQGIAGVRRGLCPVFRIAQT